MTANTVLDTSEGFLGVTNPEDRAEALKLSIEDLAMRVLARLADQAERSRHMRALLTLADGSLSNNSDSDGPEAAIWGLKILVTDSDNALCEFGGFFEALIVRAGETSHA